MGLYTKLDVMRLTTSYLGHSTITVHYHNIIITALRPPPTREENIPFLHLSRSSSSRFREVISSRAERLMSMRVINLVGWAVLIKGLVEPRRQLQIPFDCIRCYSGLRGA